MVRTKVVTFPLQISVMKKSATVTNCIVKFCKSTERSCRKSTSCPIDIPVQDRHFVFKPSNEISNEDSNSTSRCDREMVSWVVSGPKQGNLLVKLLNTNEVICIITYNNIHVLQCRPNCLPIYP